MGYVYVHTPKERKKKEKKGYVYVHKLFKRRLGEAHGGLKSYNSLMFLLAIPIIPRTKTTTTRKKKLTKPKKTNIPMRACVCITSSTRLQPVIFAAHSVVLPHTAPTW